LGCAFETGTHGVEKDEHEAAKWYRLAADQGHAVAQYSLGVCYSNGTGVVKDEREAVKWYRLAADQGYASSIDALRRMGM
jgi:TPR repeat protein